MKLSGETKLLGGILIATIAIIGLALFAFSRPVEEVAPIAQDVLISEDAHVTGNPDATVTIVEFSDLQCPACRSWQSTVQQAIQAYSNDIRFVYRHFPLDQHPMAVPAAIAAEAAGVQGKFFEMVDEIFTRQDELSDETLQEIAENLELDMELFNASLSDQVIKDKIENDRLDGISAGVNSTPSFYLNGKKMELFSQQDLLTQIEDAINSSQGE